MSQIDIVLNASKIRDKFIEDATKPVSNENEQQKFIRESKKNIYDNWISSGLAWEEFIKTLSITDKNMIGIKDNSNKTDKTFNMPTWGWIAIGIGGAAVLTLIITLAVKAGKKAKAV